MSKATSHIPPGLRAVIPQLVVSDAHELIAFAETAFGAKVQHLMPGPGGKGVMHGFFLIEDSQVFISDVVGFAKPTAANLFVYVKDVDGAFNRALEAGAKPLAPVSDMFWGDRWGMVEDPFGNAWQIATHIEDVTPEDMMKRMAAAAGAAT